MGLLDWRDDKKLDALADRFVENKIGTLLNITFEMYMEHPAYYDGLVEAMDNGHGLQLSEAGELLAVELGR